MRQIGTIAPAMLTRKAMTTKLCENGENEEQRRGRRRRRSKGGGGGGRGGRAKELRKQTQVNGKFNQSQAFKA